MGQRWRIDGALGALVGGLALAALGLVTLGMVASPANAQEGASISGIVDSAEGPVFGISVDLFTVDDEGNRDSFLQTARTGERVGGGYRFDVAPGCYMLTFVSHDLRTFTNDRTWQNVPACVDAGEAATDVNVTLRLTPLSLITVNVLRPDYTGVSGVVVDLFEAAADGSRGPWITSGTTGSQQSADPGEYHFGQRAGCYVLTYISPSDDLSFEESGQAWYNQPFCVQPGERAPYQRAFLIESPANAVEVRVLQDGVLAEGVFADLFTQNESGGRGEYLMSAASDTEGRISLNPDPGCYVMTLVAPVDYAWVANDAPWLNKPFCHQADRPTFLGWEALVSAGPSTMMVDVLVIKRGASSAPAVQVDFFQANADGSRGEFVTSGQTDPGRRTTFEVEPGEGCWVMTFVAPGNEVFEESNSRWLNVPFCTEDGIDRYPFDVVLATQATGEIDIDLSSGPQVRSGEIDVDQPIDFRVIGTPGTLVAIEPLETEIGCFDRWPLNIDVSGDGETIERINYVSCDPNGPWPIPADGVLTIGLFSSVDPSDPFPYSVVFAEVEYEDADFPLTVGAMRTQNGQITTPGDGIDYVVEGQPGQWVSVMFTDCDNWIGTFELVFLDSAEQESWRTIRDCETPDTRQFPADGKFKLRVRHWSSPLYQVPANQPFTLSAGIYEIEQVVTPTDQAVFEISGSIDVPLDRTDYVFDTTGLDALRITMVQNYESGECDVDGLALRARWTPLPTSGPLSCELTRPVHVGDHDSVTLHVSGPRAELTRSMISSGSYTLKVERIRYEVTPVDITSGSVDVSGTLPEQYTRDTYRVAAPPGSYLSAANLNVREDGFCDTQFPDLNLHASDSSGESIRSEGSGHQCERVGPWRVPADGTIDLVIRSDSRFDTGDYAYRLGWFEYGEVVVDLNDGPFEVTEALEVALDGTDYIIRGELGDEFDITVTDLGSEGCIFASRPFQLKLDLFNGQGQRIDSHDPGFDGCGAYGPWIIDETDGLVRVRAHTDGTGRSYVGSYSMRIAKTE